MLGLNYIASCGTKPRTVKWSASQRGSYGRSIVLCEMATESYVLIRSQTHILIVKLKFLGINIFIYISL